MSLLRTIESRLAQVVEGAFGKLSRSNVQPVELARRLVKEMDENQVASLKRVYVPNVYDVYLASEDHGQFESYAAGLRNELSEYLAEHARRNGYSLASRPRVNLHVDEELETGSFGIATSTEGGAVAPQDDAAPARSDAGATIIYRPSRAATADDDAPGLSREAYQLSGPDGTLVINRRRSSIGRGSMNDLVINDSSVSREHAEIVQRGAGYVVRDLGSTNGVLIDGRRVREHTLRPGDTLVLGNTELNFSRHVGNGA